MRITGKGQVTIPIEIRETLGLLPDTEVEFAIDGNAVRITRARKARVSRGQRVVQALRGRATVAMSTDENHGVDAQVTATLVDSNVILDVVTEDRRWAAWSSAALARCADEGALVINPLVYAEVSVGFERIEEVEEALPSSVFRREPLPYEAAFLAGKVFLAYRRRSGSRATPLPDFYIGAHAAVAGFRLLTRDAGRFRTCFPKVRLICPED